MSNTPIRIPADRRADDPRRVEERGVEPDRVGDVVAADHLDGERLTGRHVDRVRDPEHRAEHHDVPDLHDVRRASARTGANASSHRDRLGRHQRLALRQLVGDHAAEQPEQDDRPELGERHDARARAGRGSAAGRASPGRPAASTSRRARSPGRRRTGGSCGGGRRGRRGTRSSRRPVDRGSGSAEAASSACGAGSRPASISSWWARRWLAAGLGLLDHRVEPDGLGAQRRDLAIDRAQGRRR